MIKSNKYSQACLSNRFYSKSRKAVRNSETRKAVVGHGVDGSRGYERTRLVSLIAVADLMSLHIKLESVFER
jgi:hypothetical protein